MNKKGMIMSLDGIIALVLCGVVLMFVYSSIQGSFVDTKSIGLHGNAIDILSVLREDGSFERFDDAVIDGYLSSLPGQICANVTIYDGNQIVSNHLRPGCNGKTQTASARRSFLAEDKVYMAEAEVYYA